MIRHIVMFQFKVEAEGRTKKENVLTAKEMLENLQGVVPTLKNSYVKINHEEANPENYDLILVSEFESLSTLQEYIVHPAHKKVGEFMGKVREKRACVDFEF